MAHACALFFFQVGKLFSQKNVVLCHWQSENLCSTNGRDQTPKSFSAKEVIYVKEDVEIQTSWFSEWEAELKLVNADTMSF